MTLKERLDVYEQLMRLDKPIGILLLLWPTLWALWISSYGNPDAAVFVIFLLGVVLMRSAGCVVNDIADRDFDGRVERTKDRPLARRAISVKEAVALAAALAGIAFLLVLQLNLLVVELSVIALVLAVVYPFLKRFFWLPQAWLGIAFGFGIPMAFAATTNHVPPLAWALLAANIFWTIAYDTEYAMVDRDDDVRIGMRTSAILFGRWDVAAVMACYVLFLAIMTGIGLWQDYGAPYYAGLAAAAAIAAYHYFLIRTRARDGCFKAFRHNNWLGAAVFAGILADTTPWRELFARFL
jgi:4-hydroxybenzoate polyprenyltransferase